MRARSDLPGPSGLWDGERLLLAGLRAWARSRCSRRAPDRSVREAIACVSSDRVGALFAALMQAVESGGRRPLQVHLGACPGYADDEQRLVLACGVCAVAPDIAARLLEPLVRDADSVVCLARALNTVLAVEGLSLPVRLFDDTPAAPTIH
ncbi:MAG: hypothetical protein ACK4YQ_00670 [Phenylobacterium sp.]|uniref:hypothetical protein n=1 Tax=Phenylobacterium sp. TaxID=1871053 RepID=UPI00391CAADE